MCNMWIMMRHIFGTGFVYSFQCHSLGQIILLKWAPSEGRIEFWSSMICQQGTSDGTTVLVSYGLPPVKVQQSLGKLLFATSEGTTVLVSYCLPPVKIQQSWSAMVCLFWCSQSTIGHPSPHSAWLLYLQPRQIWHKKFKLLPTSYIYSRSFSS